MLVLANFRSPNSSSAC